MRVGTRIVLLWGFGGQPRGHLEVYRPPGAKSAPKPPSNISEFHEMPNRQTLLAEAVYGSGNGSLRRRDNEVFADLHRGAPETYTVELIVDVWAMMSIGYMESAREGVRRMGPYFESQKTKIWMGGVGFVSDVHEVRKTRTFWRDPETRKADPEEGYGARAILSDLERGGDRDDIQAALSLYATRRKEDVHRSGDVDGESPLVSATPRHPAITRKYPAGKRSSRAERTRAMYNAPAAIRGLVKCSDSNPMETCHLGDKCPNSHEHFGGKNIHCALTCELLRRGGGKNANLASLGEIDGLMQQLRKQNQRGHVREDGRWQTALGR